MKKGVEGVEGVEAVLFEVPEKLPADVLEIMKVPYKDPEIPEITAAKLAEADGFLFGFPTRYGCMAAQMKAFFYSTGQLWKEQALAGKPAGFFMDSIQGGLPYGAGVYAGDGTREPSETELVLAEHQGKYMASVVKRLLSQA
ncbi:putative NAD(P)H dehydrogenase (quinone) FQR1-like 2 [Hibiscus syriacus]|uniref:NAD(P)H dehydrogenase (quinone) n=1 Tax=Hibiscus syriacus TaxID=106335 RepID=A0A6A3ATH4_HIBSY|nr:putative NAD(P)H dehydrogenase (quinone) FQR1-like 2 [Hibiscus syriacus]